MDELTDDQLAEIASDPRFTTEDFQLLTPNERVRLARIQMAEGEERPLAALPLDIATGAAKGVGQLAFDLGSLVNSIPGVGDVTGALAKLVGPEGTDPDAAFAQTPDVLDPRNTGERVGKFAEQVGEFFVPAGPARKAAIGGLVRAIPDSAGPVAMRRLNRTAALTGRAAGEAGSAGAITAIHGEDDPDAAMATSGAAPLVGAASRRLLPSAISNPIARQVLPIAGGVALAQGTGNLTAGGLGALMGIYGLGRRQTAKALQNPRLLRRIGDAAEKGAVFGGRAGAGTIDQIRARRRRLEGER